MEANLKEVMDFLTENYLFYVATIERDKPKVRPFAFFMEFEGKLLYLSTPISGLRLKDVKTKVYRRTNSLQSE